MRKSLFTLLLSVLLCLAGCHRHLTPGEGSEVSFASSLSSSTVSSIQRDSLGYLWVGTDRGVNIFDGTNYRQLLHDRLDTASLRSDNVLGICRGRSRMWVLTDQGIDRYAGNGRFVHYRTNARSQRASCMIERKDGSVVALFGNELCLLDGLTFKRKLSISGGTDLNVAIVDDDSGRLLVNSCRGLYLVDKALTKATLFLKGDNNVVSADSNTVCRLSFTQGIVYLRRKDFSVLYRSGESMPVVANNAVIWQGTVYFSGHDGFYRIDPHTHAVTSLPVDILADSYHPFIKTMYADPQGDLWIGYIMHGLKHLKSIADWQRRLKADRALRLIRNKAVVGVVSGDQGDAWGALAHDSIFHFDGHTDSVVAIPLTGLLPIHSQQHIKGVTFSAGLFWVVTTSNVFAFHFDQGIRLDGFYDVGLAQAAPCGPFVPLPNGLAVLAGLDRLVVFDALHRGETIKEVRLAANGVPVVCQTGDLTVTTRRVAGVDFTSVSDAVGTNRNLFIKEGLNGWEAIDLKSGKVARASFPLKAGLLASASQGSHLFFGTDDGLYVYDPSQSRLTAVGGFSGKAVNNVVVSQGTASTVLMTIGGAVVAYDVMEHRSHVVWEGIDRDDFLPSTLALLPGNRLLAANRKGLQLFQIPSHGERVRLPALHLEALDVLMPRDKVESTGLLQADSCSTVVLSHTRNHFKIRYAAIAETLTDNYAYRYKLEGYDQQWRESDGSGEAAYDEVRPGTYRFIVKCVDRTHPWVSRTASVSIRVKPHPLMSGVALCVYVVLVLVLIYVSNRMYLRMRMVRLNADMTEKERHHEQQVNEMNMNFFANISHEFRNPLTMISGPLALLGKAPELSKQSANLVRIIMQSASIMRKLVGQMLDFRELEGEAMRLSVSRMDVAAIIADYGHHYELTAAEKGIKIVFHGTDNLLVMLADKDKIIKVFDNLMTNAIRHTPQNGTITVTLARRDNDMLLSVENSGNPIPEGQLSRIFEQYGVLDASVAAWGAGLGLHYVRSLVRLHHGQITAANTATGVCFTVSLPTDESAYTEKERAPRNADMSRYDLHLDGAGSDEDIKRPVHHEETGLAADDARPRLLIVERDINTAFFLRHLFEADYKVFNRYEGERALSDVDEIRPDLIISCVMLDDLSGFDLCSMLRDDKHYDRPFIFLTTCSAGDQQAAGMKAGADYYITKPFDPDYLQEVVRKALNNVRAYEALLRQLPQKQTAKHDEELSKRDKEILRITQRFMKENISSSELDVNKLGRKLLLSRTKLYMKIKELTGSTPNELFRVYKLNYAASLLKAGKLNVTEVASQAGFSSVAFFSRSFKKHFGVSPRDYS